jgi:hypothetical protein
MSGGGAGGSPPFGSGVAGGRGDDEQRPPLAELRPTPSAPAQGDDGRGGGIGTIGPKLLGRTNGGGAGADGRAGESAPGAVGVPGGTDFRNGRVSSGAAAERGASTASFAPALRNGSGGASDPSLGMRVTAVDSRGLAPMRMCSVGGPPFEAPVALGIGSAPGFGR